MDSVNPFLSSLEAFGSNIVTTASGAISKTTDTLIDAAAIGLQNRVVGSVSPTGSTSPDAATARAAAANSAAALNTATSTTLPSWVIPAAAVVGVGLVLALILRK